MTMIYAFKKFEGAGTDRINQIMGILRSVLSFQRRHFGIEFPNLDKLLVRRRARIFERKFRYGHTKA
jgi:hypothetical protein